MLGLLPRRTTEFPLREPELLGSAILACEVEGARVADECTKPVGMAGNPVHHEPAVRSPTGGHALTVEEFVFPQRVVKALDQVFVDPAGPVLADLVGELLPIAGGAAGVDRHDRIAGRAEHLIVPPAMPLVVPGAL